MHERLMAELAADYGKVPPEEYVARLNVLQTPWRDKETLAIYREYGVDDDGEAYAEARGSCRECSYDFKVEIRQQTDLNIPPPEDARAWESWRERLLNPEQEKNRR